MNGQISLFDLTALPFEDYLRKTICAPGILQLRKPKIGRIFKNGVFEKKGWTITHEKCRFLLEMDFPKTSLKFYMEKIEPLYCRIIPRMLGFDGRITILGITAIRRCFGASVPFREAYSTCMLQVWYPLIDIHFTLLHVEIKDGVYLGFENQGNSLQKVTTGNRTVSKSQSVQTPPAHCISHPAVFKNSCVRSKHHDRSSKMGHPGRTFINIHHHVHDMYCR
jgi:hypothetical protein